MIRFATHIRGVHRARGPHGLGAAAGRARSGRGPWVPPGAWLPLALLSLLLCCTGAALAFDPDTADVVAIVDTSKSMTERGMDPERTSLLVSKLLADILPGHFAVVRLLDLSADKALLPRTETSETGSCSEGGGVCRKVEPVGDWGELAHRNRYGVLERDRQGDQAFKDRLAGHLAQTGTNSYFFMAFRAAQGLLEHHAAAGEASDNRTIIWLSDGRDEATGKLAPAIADLRNAGTRIETFIFGRGDPAIPEQLGLNPIRVTSPAELMGAFAQVFRQIMQAPYRVDHLVDQTPEFRVRPNVATMWVVLYGDTGLGDVTLHGADGRTHKADFAADTWPSAGAYRVARIDSPVPGAWRVATAGGGPKRAYAVIQRSSLGLQFLEPKQAQAQVQTRLVAAVTAGTDPAPVTEREALEGARISARIDGVEVAFNDDGSGADTQAGDGRFTAFYRFMRAGPQPVELKLASPFAQATRTVSIDVAGVFRYAGAEPELRFGTRQAPTAAPVCLPVVLDPAPETLEHRGTLPFELAAADWLPAGHRLWMRVGGTRVDPGGAVDWAAGAPLEVCLELDASAPSSRVDGNRTLMLQVRGTDSQTQHVRLRLHWEVQGLSFWQRWGWAVLLGLAVLAALILVLGYLLPKRFQPTLAISYGPERDDVDEYPPQAIRNWPGVGIGLYRNARAFLHRDFRLTGRTQGALAGLYAQGATTRVQAQRGLTLFREDVGGGWSQVPATGENARPGEVYRVGDTGPFFRLSAR